MKRFVILLVIGLSPLAANAMSGKITSNASTCPAASNSTALIVGLPMDKGGGTITVAGTWTGTISFKGTGDGGTTWSTMKATPLDLGADVSSTTANGTWQRNFSGFTGICILATASMTGTAIVTVTPSGEPFARGGSSSSGGGTVTSVSGTVNQIDVATGTTTPVLSLDPALILPGTLTVPGALTAGSIATSPTGGVGGGFVSPEGTAPATIAGVTVPQAGYDACYADSTTHSILCSYNNGAFAPSSRVVFKTPNASFHASQSTVSTGITPSVNTRYRFSCAMSQVDIGTSCAGTSTATATINYTDADSSQAETGSITGFAGSGASVLSSWTIPVTLGATSSFRCMTTAFNAKAGVAITYTVTYGAGTSCAPGPNISFYPVLEQLP